MNLEADIKKGIAKAFNELFDHSLPIENISLQPTRKEFEGTHTFVVFPFLKFTHKKPEESAHLIGRFLKKNCSLIDDFNVVKGFLNLKLNHQVWLETLKHIIKEKEYGIQSKNGKKVMVEFSSPNTNKPLHLGHLRNIFLGDSVSRILVAAGYEVMKTNLVNDRGIHICKSMVAYQKFGKGETPETSGIKGDHLVGKYYVIFDQHYKNEIEELVAEGMGREKAKKEAPILLEAQEMLKKWEDNDTQVRTLWEQMNNWVYEGFDITYNNLGVSFDRVYKESITYLLGKDVIAEGLKKEVFFKKENGSVWVDLTQYGLDEKLVLRADGTSVYITQDIGTSDYKYRDFSLDKSVYVVGNEQDYHFQVLFNIMKNLGRDYAGGMYHLSYGMVDLPTGKMKSREGTVVDADDLILEMIETAAQQTKALSKAESFTEAEAKILFKKVGLGALKYFLLKVDPKKNLLFNPAESIEFQGNTGPFIQYTYARIAAIIRRAKTLDIQLEEVNFPGKLNVKELDIIRIIEQFPITIQNAAREYSPASIAQYAHELAKTYNSFYQEVPIFKDNEYAVFKIILSRTVAQTINTSMGLLGIEVLERM